MPNATADQIMATILQDVVQMEKCHIWPFSCYAVVKEMAGGISGFVDVSPEELRINYLLNQNNLAVHNDSVNILSAKVNETRQRLRNSGNRDQIYQEYRNGGNNNPSSAVDLSWLNIPGQRCAATATTTSAFGSNNAGFGSPSQTGSSFGSNPFASSTAANPFGSAVQKPNPFGGSATPQPAFGSTTSFGSATPNTNSGSFGQNPFGSSTSTPSSFGATTNTNSNPFGSTQSPTQSAFGAQQAAPPQNANPFQQQAPVPSSTGAPPANPFLAQTATPSVFGQTLPIDQKDQVSRQDDSIVYTPLERLTQSEIAAFSADTFTIENIPINPPPKEACVA